MCRFALLANAPRPLLDIVFQRELDEPQIFESGCGASAYLMLRFMVEEQASRPREVSSMRLCMAGVYAVPVTLQERFQEHFGFRVREIFGMTETAHSTAETSRLYVWLGSLE